MTNLTSSQKRMIERIAIEPKKELQSIEDLVIYLLENCGVEVHENPETKELRVFLICGEFRVERELQQ